MRGAWCVKSGAARGAERPQLHAAAAPSTMIEEQTAAGFLPGGSRENGASRRGRILQINGPRCYLCSSWAMRICSGVNFVTGMTRVRPRTLAGTRPNARVSSSA